MNPIDKNRQFLNSGGIGLQNFKKRLNLYYPNKHNCEITSSETHYSVNLTIDI